MRKWARLEHREAGKEHEELRGQDDWAGPVVPPRGSLAWGERPNGGCHRNEPFDLRAAKFLLENRPDAIFKTGAVQRPLFPLSPRYCYGTATVLPRYWSEELQSVPRSNTVAIPWSLASALGGIGCRWQPGFARLGGTLCPQTIRD